MFATTFVVVFLVQIMGQPPMQAGTKKTWPTIEACEADLQTEGTKFAKFLIEVVKVPPDTKVSAECVSNPREGV